MKLDATTAKLVLGSPSTSAETLAEVAKAFPDLQARVAAHPNASPELLAWLAASGTPDAQATARNAAATRLADSPPEAIPTAPAIDPTAIDPTAVGQTPPRHWPKGGRLAVIAGVCAVAIALVVWLIVLPQLTNRGALSAPDITAKPAWSAPMALVPPSAANTTDQPLILDPQAGSIAVAYWNSGGTTEVQGIDLAKPAKVWQLERTVSGNLTAASGYVIFYTEDATTDGLLELIDARTGKTTATVALAPGETVQAAGNGIVLTWSNGTSCARALASPAHCAWQTASSSGFVSVFGGGTWAWFSDSRKVLNWKTGQLAPFGSDATIGDYTSWVGYDGPDANHIVRMTDATPGSGISTETVQPWDTAHDRGFFPAVISDVAVVDQKTSTLVTTQTSGASTAVAAQDWQTGAIRWQATVDWGFEPTQILWASTCSDSVILSAVPYGDPGVSVTNSWMVVNTQTQQKAWSSDGAAYTWLGNGNRVVYMMRDLTLIAFDAASPAFDQLWTLDMPADTRPSIVAGHIIAQAGTYLWVAQ